MWDAWCAQCHAADGSGKVAAPTITVAPMDFSDCTVATPEPDTDWALAISHGGLAVGLSAEMPAFGDTLTADQISGLVAHMRDFCQEGGWPIGNTNFPRPIFTEKGFPENELVIRPMITHRRPEVITLGSAPFATDSSLTDFDLLAIYERRFGQRGMWEVAMPIASHDTTGFSRRQGVGDLEVGVKYVLHENSRENRAPRIVSTGFEVVLATGSEVRGLGAGTTLLEPYLAAGALVGSFYVQTQATFELPVDTAKAARAFVYNIYVGGDTSLAPNTWTVGVELNGEVIGRSSARSLVAVTPQVRKGLTKTGALAAAVGVQLPLNDRQRRGTRVVSYLLWEYMEPVRARH
jgi:hypothetical protein